MFRNNWLLGFTLLLIIQLTILTGLQPNNYWYTPLIWYAYIIILDGINHHLSRKSLITKKPLMFLLLMLVSLPFWAIYELVSIQLTVSQEFNYASFIHLFSFIALLPAVFETNCLFKNLKLLTDKRLNIKASKRVSYSLSITGMLFLILSILIPEYFLWALWLSLFLMIDSVNYLNNNLSIIGLVRNKELFSTLQLCIAGLVGGLIVSLFIAPNSIINVILLGTFPAFSYLLYLPLGLSLFSIYNYTKRIV